MDDRRDFPGGFPGDPRDAFSAAGRTPDEQRLFAAYRDLLRLRRSSPALRRGTLIELIANETVYACLRQDGAERMVFALNLGKAPAVVKLPPEIDGPARLLWGDARWTDAPGGPSVELPGESAAIFRLGQ